MARKKRKLTPEERERERQRRARSDENLRRLRELVDRGWDELARRRESTSSPPA